MTGYVLQYARLAVVFAAWFFVERDPTVFVALHTAAFIISYIERLKRYLVKEETEVFKNLDDVASLFQFALLLFSVVLT